MFYNYLKVALRNLVKNRTFSIINIFGLASGLACCLLIAAFIYEELHYDRYPAQAANIFRIGLHVTDNGHTDDYPMVDGAVGPGIKNAFPEVLAATRITPLGNLFIKYNDKQFKEQHIAACDSDFLKIFSIPLTSGDERTALAAPNSMVV